MLYFSQLGFNATSCEKYNAVPCEIISSCINPEFVFTSFSWEQLFLCSFIGFEWVIKQRFSPHFHWTKIAVIVEIKALKPLEFQRHSTWWRRRDTNLRSPLQLQTLGCSSYNSSLTLVRIRVSEST